jgi:hypothetical protein
MGRLDTTQNILRDSHVPVAMMTIILIITLIPSSMGILIQSPCSCSHAAVGVGRSSVGLPGGLMAFALGRLDITQTILRDTHIPVVMMMIIISPPSFHPPPVFRIHSPCAFLVQLWAWGGPPWAYLVGVMAFALWAVWTLPALALAHAAAR